MFEDQTRIEYHSGSDSLGRCHFSLHWMTDYTPGHPDGEYVRRERGQHFFADPREYNQLRPENHTEAVKRAARWADWYHVHACTLRMVAAAQDPAIKPQHVGIELLEWFDTKREAQRTHDSGVPTHA